MKKLLIAIIKFYRRFLSPLKRGFYYIFSPFLVGEVGCRFHPTCSEYAIEAIEKYGALKGSIMAAKRILRCNPFNKGGYDPVKWLISIQGGLEFEFHKRRTNKVFWVYSKLN